MAKLGNVASGFVPAEPPKPKPKKSKKASFITLHCDNCGYEEGYSVHKAKKWFSPDYGEGKENEIQYCRGCTDFFGLADSFSMNVSGIPISSAYTSDSPAGAKEKIKRIKEAKFILIKNTQKFVGVNTGVKIEVNFGDIFPVIRAGADFQTELGNTKAAFNASTIDIKFGPETLTLYTHEVIPIDWLDVMLLRKDKIVEEQFLSSDCQGYFAPTQAGKKLLTETFGSR